MDDTPTRFDQVAAQLAANGYRPVPIRPDTKYPGFDDWQHFAFAAGCEGRFPNHGAGVLLGDLVGLDIDVECPDAAVAVETAIREILHIGDAAEIPRRIGRAPRVLLPLRCETPFAKLTTAQFRMRSCPEAKPSKVELPAKGQQFVAYHVHPETHRPYTWNGAGDLLTVPRDQLPEITETQALEIVHEAETILEEWGERVSEAPGDNAQGATPGETIADGGRNDTLYKFGCKLARARFTIDEIELALLAMNASRCRPPLDDDEVRTIVRKSITKLLQGDAPGPADPLPQGEFASALLERDMPMIHYLADPWIPEGLNIIAGRPKLGKSTLLRQRQAAVASGGEFWGAPCSATACIYLSLEEGDRLTRAKFSAANFPRAALERIEIFYEWPRGIAGILQVLQMLDARPEVRHVGVDSLSRFRAIPDARTPAFQADYEAVSALHDVCKARPGLAIDLIHHTRKLKSDDPLDDISGTYGLSAGCDSYAIMRHAEDGALLFIGGRLWCRDEHQYELKRDNQRWQLVGAFTGLTDVQKTTLDTLRASGGQGPTECAKYWGIAKTTAQDRLESLVRHGVAYSKQGVYHAKM